MLKKIFIIFTVLLLVSCVSAQNNSTITINGVEFEIPAKYQGGEFKNDKYSLDNNFTIRCIDDNVPKSIGFWAQENKFSEDLSIGTHPVRHYCQHNEYVHGNHSHAYFVSGESVYEISWVGKEIDSDIENLITNTPASEISDEDFYETLDFSIDKYKQEKIDKSNADAEYNYLEAKFKSQNAQQNTIDDTKFKEILFTYYLNN